MFAKSPLLLLPPVDIPCISFVCIPLPLSTLLCYAISSFRLTASLTTNIYALSSSFSSLLFPIPAFAGFDPILVWWWYRKRCSGICSQNWIENFLTVTGQIYCTYVQKYISWSVRTLWRRLKIYHTDTMKPFSKVYGSAGICEIRHTYEYLISLPKPISAYVCAFSLPRGLPVVGIVRR